MQTTVSVKGQITIPKKLRRRLGIETGTLLRFVEERGRIVIEKVIAEDPVTQAYGRLSKLGMRTDDVLKELRYDDEEEE